MNILYIAYSCSPYYGSECKIGWNVPLESAKTNNVHVITMSGNKAAIEKYLSENKVYNIKFYFVDIPIFYKKIFNSGYFYSGRLNIWNKRAFPVAKEICKKEKIDIIHQITPIEFRSIGDYGKISDIRFVLGPLGGGESVPRGLRKYIKGKYIIVELIRMFCNHWCRLKLKISGKLEKCDYIMFANKETKDFLQGCCNLQGTIFFDSGLCRDELS